VIEVREPPLGQPVVLAPVARLGAQGARCAGAVRGSAGAGSRAARRRAMRSAATARRGDRTAGAVTSRRSLWGSFVPGTRARPQRWRSPSHGRTGESLDRHARLPRWAGSWLRRGALQRALDGK
jgi:hypothetical protein